MHIIIILHPGVMEDQENEGGPEVFLDLVQEALHQVRDAIGCYEDLDGVLIRLDAIFQSLMWVEPVFLPSEN